MAERTATNPQTGERVRLVNGQWIPMAKEAISNLNTLGRNTLGSMFESSQNLVEQGANASINAANRAMSGIHDVLNPNIFGEPKNYLLPGLEEPAGRNGPPQIPNVILPKSDRNDLFGAAQLAGEATAALVTGDPNQFSSNPIQQQAQVSQESRQQNPNMALVGDLFGPALLVGGARSPQAAANGIREIARRTLASRNGFGFMKEAAPGASSGGAISLARQINGAFTTSNTAQWVATRFPRVVEAGIEGATIALIDEGDPLEVAAWTAGTQAAGSLALSLTSGLTGDGPLHQKGRRLAGYAMGMSMFIEIAKSLTPGGEDRDFARFFQSFGTTTAKLAGAMGLGAFAGIAGLGRSPSRSKSILDSAVSISDAATAIPRNAVFSILNDWQKDDRIEPVLSRMASDPGYFNAEANRRIERAFLDGRTSLTNILDELSKNTKFLEKLDAL